jgi:hypothetical protein
LKPDAPLLAFFQAAMIVSAPIMVGLSSCVTMREGWRRGVMESMDLEASERTERMFRVVCLRVVRSVMALAWQVGGLHM